MNDRWESPWESPLRSLNGTEFTDYIPYESTHSFDQSWTSAVEDPTQRLPHTTGLKSNVYDPFWGVPKDDVLTEFDSEWLSSPHSWPFDPINEEYLADQPELIEESAQSLALSSFDVWPRSDLGPSSYPSNLPLLVQGTTATTPNSSTGASSGSTNSSAVAPSPSPPSPSTSDSASSTNFFSGLTSTNTVHEGATSSLSSLIGAPQTLQPKRGLKCPDCQRILSCSARLRNHQCNTKRFLCDFDGCTGGFTQEKDLQRHRQSLHADKALLRVCQVCQYKTPRKDHLQRHERSHQDGRRKRVRKEEGISVSPRKE